MTIVSEAGPLPEFRRSVSGILGEAEALTHGCPSGHFSFHHSKVFGAVSWAGDSEPDPVSEVPFAVGRQPEPSGHLLGQQGAR